jgi:glycosyltransferase involved in cell wall biosynthesis
MRRILFVAPRSYPISAAEEIVNIKLLQVLSEAGFEIDLISKRNKSQDYPSVSFESLGIRVNSLNIIEVENKLNPGTLWKHFISMVKFGIAFKGSHWAVKALPVAVKLVNKNQYDYVLTKSFPGPLLGYYLKREYGIKWIATWNDPFPASKYPEPYGKGINGKVFILAKRLIPNVRKYADLHIFPSDRLRDYMLSYLKVERSKTRIIPHVVLNFHGLKEGVERSDAVLKIIHSGNVSRPRDPMPFLLAVKNFIEKNNKPKIQVTFLGITDSDFQKRIFELELDEYVVLKDPVDYFKSIEILSDFHCAVIIEAPCSEGIFLPSKVSDYFQSDICVFAISPKTGVLNDLFNSGHISYFADCTDVNSIETELTRIFTDFNLRVLKKPESIKPEYLPEYIVAQYRSF